MIREQLNLPEPAPKPQATPKPRPWTQLCLNRNFMNYPLARPGRTKAVWHEDRCDRCCLPGDDRIELSVPPRSPVRRLPTGFDMNILFRLLAAVQQSHGDRVEFASLAALARDLHLSARDNRGRVVDALELWGHLAIFYGRWYQRGGTHVERNFPPPVRHVDFKGRSMTVTVAREWVRLAGEKEYFKAVPLPLPSDSSTQNLALMVLTSRIPPLGEGGDGRGHLNFSDPLKRQSICRKIGLRHEAKKLASILRRIGAVSLRGLLRIPCRA